MALKKEDRYELDNIIDYIIAGIPGMVRYYRDPKVKENLLLQNVSDFVLGHVMAAVAMGFELRTAIPRGHHITQEERAEIIQVLDRRALEIRHAIEDVR